MVFILVSGKTGTALDGPVKYSTNGEGKVIGPLVHITSRGAIYILFGFGKMHLASAALHLSEKTFVLSKMVQTVLGYFCHSFCCKSYERKSTSLTAIEWKSTEAPIPTSLKYFGVSQRHIMPGKFQLWVFHCLLPQLQWSQSLSLFHWVFAVRTLHLYSSWQVMFKQLPWGISLPKPETGTTFLQCCNRRSQSGKSADLSTCQSSLTFTGRRGTCHLAASGNRREG